MARIYLDGGRNQMTAKEPPSVARLRELLRYDPETGKLFWKQRAVENFSTQHYANIWNTKNAGKEAGWDGSKDDGYRRLAINRQCFLSHRVVWAIVHGAWPTVEIDHKDQNRRNNTIDNLREVARQINCMNVSMMRTNTSGCTGVFKSRAGNWWVEVQIRGKREHVGTFYTFEDAVLARKQAQDRLGFSVNHGRAAT